MKTIKIKNNHSRRPLTPPAQSFDFQEVVRLLAAFSDATTRLAELETRANAALLTSLAGHQDEYATLQAACKQTETALENLCRAHPEWFTAARSLKTPYAA